MLIDPLLYYLMVSPNVKLTLCFKEILYLEQLLRHYLDFDLDLDLDLLILTFMPCTIIFTLWASAVQQSQPYQFNLILDDKRNQVASNAMACHDGRVSTLMFRPATWMVNSRDSKSN